MYLKLGLYTIKMTPTVIPVSGPPAQYFIAY